MRHFFSISFIILRIISFQCITILSVIISYILKFKLGLFSLTILHFSWGSIYTHTQIEDYLRSIWILCLLSLVIHISCSLFSRIHLEKRTLDYSIVIIKAQFFITIGMIALHIVKSPFPLSKSVFILWFFISTLMLILGHLLMRNLGFIIACKFHLLRNCLVIGVDDISLDITEKLLVHQTRLFNYVGTLASEEPAESHYMLRNNLRVIGQPNQLETVIQAQKIDIIFLADPSLLPLDPATIERLVDEYQLEFRFVSPPFRYEHSLLLLTPFFGSLLYVFKPYRPPAQLGIKILFEWVLSFLILIVMSPLMVFIGLWIKAVDRNGPIIYQQSRFGLNRVPFTMLKFRTMTVHAENNVPKWVHEHVDPPFIWGGALIRRLSLDELPQLLNILIGNMTLIGPRPERPYFAEKIEEKVPHFRYRTLIKPGITGWAQVNGRSALTAKPDQKIKYDLHYIKDWSFSLDFKILFLTLLIVIQQEEVL